MKRLAARRPVFSEMDAMGPIPGVEAAQATEMSTRLRRKKREDLIDQGTAQCAGGRRHKERTALGKIDANAPQDKDMMEKDVGCADTTVKPDPLNDVEAMTEDGDALMSASDVLAVSSDNGTHDDAAAESPLELEVGPVSEVWGAVADLTSDDPSNVPEYVDDIFEYLRGSESKFMPKARYMRKQRDINHSMRSILVDWLVEVAQEYKLNTQTLFIAIGYIDRFLSEMSVQRTKLQLVGVTAMLLAAKYEEIYPPAVDEFVYITDNTYNREQILKMEHLILKALQFDMGGITAYSFLQRFIMIVNADDVTKNLAMYLIELTLQDGERYLKYLPSRIAAAALCNALAATKKPCWTPALEHYAKLTVEDIRECVHDVYLTFTHAASSPQQAVREKYSHNRYHNVSQMPPPLTPPLQ